MSLVCRQLERNQPANGVMTLVEWCTPRHYFTDSSDDFIGFSFTRSLRSFVFLNSAGAKLSKTKNFCAVMDSPHSSRLIDQERKLERRNCSAVTAP